MLPSPVRDARVSHVFGLDLLRAAAVVMVLIGHGISVLYPHHPLLSYLGHGGAYGVELFFVLSGFLIGRILIQTGPDLGRGSELTRFFLRRWFRTLPLFWVMLWVNVLLHWRWTGTWVGGVDALGHQFFLKNFEALHLSFMVESWSLAVEEWFYLLLPLAIFAGLRLRLKFSVIFVWAAATILLASTLLRARAGWFPSHEWSTTQRCVVIYRFDALMYGVLAAWVSLRWPELWRRLCWPGLAIGVALLLCMYGSLLFSGDTYFARTWRFTLISLGFALLLPGSSLLQIAKSRWWSRLVSSLALWSYSLYLIHLPWFEFCGRLNLRSADSAFQAYCLFALKFGGALVLSFLAYQVIERPFLRLRESLTRGTARA